MILTGRELNKLFGASDLYFPFLKYESKFTKKIIDELNDYTKNDYSNLIDYTIKLEVDGDHRYDGQMVDYYFTFINPAKEKTEIYTEMCLEVGFNLQDDKIYKIK